MNRTNEEKRHQELITLLHSTPESVQKIALRFLKLSMVDAAFRSHYQAATAERYMTPAELDAFMDRWIAEREGKEAAG